jgi:transposase
VIGSDLANFTSPDALAAFAGMAPAPHDSGKRNGNLHRPRHCHRGLQRVLAVIALARRRNNVLWALIRDRRLYEVTPPKPTG